MIIFKFIAVTPLPPQKKALIRILIMNICLGN